MWKWFETPWAGTDGNTGRKAYIVDFLRDTRGAESEGILAFYIMHNRHDWFAVPSRSGQSMGWMHMKRMPSYKLHWGAARLRYPDSHRKKKQQFQPKETKSSDECQVT